VCLLTQWYGDFCYRKQFQSFLFQCFSTYQGHCKSLYDIFSDLHRTDSITLICNISWKFKKKKKTCLPALKKFPMLGETNNQFYMASPFFSDCRRYVLYKQEQCVHSFIVIAGGICIINKNSVFTLFSWSQEVYAL
jgi:hypothetical protein